MIYLTTGANGAGKTLNTLELVRKKQVEEGRTVYFAGFKMRPEKAAEFGWLPCDPLLWQDLPDGAIIIWDECQRVGHLEAIGSGAKNPPHVAMLAEHRSRGFDFFLITQHPLMLNKFVLRLIGSPGWHRHLKRAFGADMVSVLEWSVATGNCEKTGAAKTGKVTMVAFPKHVYEWYDSAVLHTGKKSIPWQIYLGVVLVVALPLAIWFAIKSVRDVGKVVTPPQAAGSAFVATAAPLSYFEALVPRINGLPHTAPKYDDLTKPTAVPVPAACIKMGTRCSCYTQQGTYLAVTAPICLQIVKGGYFEDFAREIADQSSNSAPSAPPARVPGAPVDALPSVTAARLSASRDAAAVGYVRGHTLAASN